MTGAYHCFVLVFYWPYKALYTVWSKSPIPISISHHNQTLTKQKRELKRLGSQTATELQEFAPVLCKTMTDVAEEEQLRGRNLGFWHHLWDTSQHISQQKHHQWLNNLFQLPNLAGGQTPEMRCRAVQASTTQPIPKCSPKSLTQYRPLIPSTHLHLSPYTTALHDSPKPSCACSVPWLGPEKEQHFPINLASAQLQTDHLILLVKILEHQMLNLKPKPQGRSCKNSPDTFTHWYCIVFWYLPDCSFVLLIPHLPKKASLLKLDHLLANRTSAREVSLYVHYSNLTAVCHLKVKQLIEFFSVRNHIDINCMTKSQLNIAMVTLLIAARRHDDGMTAVLLASDATLQPGARESLAVESYLGFFCSASLFIFKILKDFFQWQL